MNLSGLLDQLLQSGQSAVQNVSSLKPGKASDSSNSLGALLAGAGGGALAAGALGMLMGSKKARKVGGKALTYGGLAALGMVAYKALSKRQQVNASSSLPLQEPPRTLDRLPQPEVEQHSRAVLQAIVAAAKADGHIDDRERQVIDDAIAQMTEDPNIHHWFDQELRKPLDPAEVARSAASPEMAAEMYLASLLVVDEQNYMERAYLDELARQLKFDPSFKMELEQQARQLSA